VAKTKAQQPERTRPITVESLGAFGVLSGLSPPAERFDPAGEWTQTYRLWMVQRYRSGGKLVVRRAPSGRDGVRLRVESTIAEYGGHLRRLEAVLDCAADTLCSPRGWRLKATHLDVRDKPTAGSGLSERGTLADGAWTVRFGDRSRTRKVPSPVTSNWSLFEAVQRLPGKDTQPLGFAMLDEMDLLKLDQQLSFCGTKQVQVGGRKRTLRGYAQIGCGVLPWQYWVDEQGRLLLAFSGVRAYVWDPQAEQFVQKQRKAAQSRALGRR